MSIIGNGIKTGTVIKEIQGPSNSEINIINIMSNTTNDSKEIYIGFNIHKLAVGMAVTGTGIPKDSFVDNIDSIY